MPTAGRILSAYLGIVPRTPEAAVLRLLIELGIECVGADEGSLLVVDRKRGDLVFAMTAGQAESEKTLAGQRVPIGKGLTGLAAATREVQIGAPTFKDLKQRRRADSREGHPSAVMAAPMLIRDEVVGVITAASFDPRKRFTQRDGSLYAKIASVAAVVVEQHRRLREAEALGAGRAPARPISGEERRRRAVVDAVAALVAGHPGRLKEVAALLRAVEALGSRAAP